MKAISLWHYCLPLSVPLAMRYGTLSQREGLLLELADAERLYWCEIAPFPGLSQESLADCCDWVRAYQNNLWAVPAPGPALAWALTAATQAANLSDAWGRVPLNALLTAAEPPQIAITAEHLYATGYRCFKLKVVGGSLLSEQQRIEALLRAVGPDIQLRLDVNRRWSLAEALEMARFLADKPLDYLEEPLSDLAEIPRLYAATGCPIALDESLLQLSPQQLCWESLSALVLKPALSGGDAVWAWAAAAREHGKSVTISSVFESGLGLLHLAVLACRLSPGVPAGLDTWRALAGDVLQPPLQAEQGCLIDPGKRLDNPVLQPVNLVKILL